MDIIQVLGGKIGGAEQETRDSPTARSACKKSLIATLEQA